MLIINTIASALSYAFRKSEAADTDTVHVELNERGSVLLGTREGKEAFLPTTYADGDGQYSFNTDCDFLDLIQTLETTPDAELDLEVYPTHARVFVAGRVFCMTVGGE